MQQTWGQFLSCTIHIYPIFLYHLLTSSATETFQITFFIVANLRIPVEYTYNVIY